MRDRQQQTWCQNYNCKQLQQKVLNVFQFGQGCLVRFSLVGLHVFCEVIVYMVYFEHYLSNQKMLLQMVEHLSWGALHPDVFQQSTCTVMLSLVAIRVWLANLA